MTVNRAPRSKDPKKTHTGRFDSVRKGRMPMRTGLSWRTPWRTTVANAALPRKATWL